MTQREEEIEIALLSDDVTRDESVEMLVETGKPREEAVQLVDFWLDGRSTAAVAESIRSISEKHEIRRAAAALKSNDYHDFADGEAEAIARSMYKKGFRIVRRDG